MNRTKSAQIYAQAAALDLKILNKKPGARRLYQIGKPTGPDGEGFRDLSPYLTAGAAADWLDAYEKGQRAQQSRRLTNQQSDALENLLDFFLAGEFDNWKAREAAQNILNGDPAELEEWSAETLAGAGYHNIRGTFTGDPLNGWTKTE